MSYQKYFFRILSVLIGLFFVFSAYVKLYPIEVLEIALVETGFINWSVAPFFARILIGSEFLIGVFLIINLWTKFFSFLASLSLIIFSVYLLIILSFQGNEVNCNCLGLFLVMNPIESIIKNIILLSFLILLFLKNKSIHFKFEKIAIWVVGVLLFVIPFVLNPISIGSETKNQMLEASYPLDFSIIYSNPKIEQPKADLRVGKHLIAFFSSKCQHCIVSGYNLKVLSDQHEKWSIYFFINGDDDDLAQFHVLTKSEAIPHSKLPGKELLMIAGNKLPAIYLVNNSMVEKRIMPNNIDENDINQWFLK